MSDMSDMSDILGKANQTCRLPCWFAILGGHREGPAPMTFHGALYRFVNDPLRQLLYVGVTVNPAARFRQHMRRTWWEQVTSIRITHFWDREALYAAERLAIRTEHPILECGAQRRAR